MTRTWTVVGLVGFLSACIGLYQAFSFNHLPRLQVVYECGGGGDTNIFEFIHALETRAGEVVMLDLRMCANGFARRELDDRIQWDFSEGMV